MLGLCFFMVGYDLVRKALVIIGEKNQSFLLFLLESFTCVSNQPPPPPRPSSRVTIPSFPSSICLFWGEVRGARGGGGFDSPSSL